jgi:hypothetical protein
VPKADALGLGRVPIRTDAAKLEHRPLVGHDLVEVLHAECPVLDAFQHVVAEAECLLQEVEAARRTGVPEALRLLREPPAAHERARQGEEREQFSEPEAPHQVRGEVEAGIGGHSDQSPPLETGVARPQGRFPLRADQLAITGFEDESRERRLKRLLAHAPDL